MLSVVVITKNEESRIRACLESVKWADELIVVDNGSNDNTLKKAREYTDQIFEVDLQDFAEIRNFAIGKAKGDWVLYIDADERVLSPLKDEIHEIIETDKYSAIALSRKNIVFGQEVSYGPFSPDWVIRLLKKNAFEQWMGRVHEYPKFRGQLGYSKESLIHLTHRSLDQIVLKSLEWSKIDAKLRLEANHPKMTGWRFLRILMSELFNQGFKRGGFFNGTVSIMDSILQSFSMYMSYVRLWEMQQPKTLSQIYDDIDKKLIQDNFKD